MSMNPFRGKTQYFEFGRESALQVERLIKAVSDAAPGETSIVQKLDAVIEMLRAQAGVAADLALVKEELGLVHQLLANLVDADPEKIKEITDAVRSVKEKLKSSVDSQTPKGD